MKQLLIILALCGSQMLQAQDYIPLAVENARWQVGFDDYYTPWLDELNEYMIKGDTSINAQEYKKLYLRELHPDNLTYGKEILLGVLREDTEARQVFSILFEDEIWGCNTDEEFLLYDFSHQIGDDFYYCFFAGNFEADTLYEITNQMIYEQDRRTYHTYLGTYYEGIGSALGLYEIPNPGISGFNKFLYNYCIGTDEECGVLYVSSPEIIPTTSVSVFPNPTMSCIYIRFPNYPYEVEQITISNIRGEIIRTYDSIEDRNAYNVEDLVPGIYLVQIHSASETLLSRKIIKHQK